MLLFVPWLTLPPPSTHAVVYDGALLGVTARVQLFEAESYADVVLTGLPVGGRLAGRATFGAEGELVLEARLEVAMRRRLCSILAVTPSPDRSTLRVDLALPLFGRRTLHMRRATEEREGIKAAILASRVKFG
jgi:hypothetical protein